jgi:hypothetical protein
VTRPGSKLRGCRGKAPYSSYLDAQQAAIHLLRLAHVELTSIYVCPYCARYHVTTKASTNWIWRAEREEAEGGGE